LIRVQHLSKIYAASRAVDDISFAVDRHEIVGFLGPNGAGKSTTLKVLTGFHSATSGEVHIDGINVDEAPEAVKRRIGYLPENVPLYPEMRVSEYLGYRAALKAVPRKQRRAAIDSAMERCRITEVQNRIVGQLSKGFRQRVGLADALLADPPILILDEPTVGLDPNQIRDIRDLIRALGQERTVILSSHILPEVEAVCSRVIIINKGKIVGQGRPDELRAGLGEDAAVRVTLRGDNRAALAALQALPGVREVRRSDEAQQDASTYLVYGAGTESTELRAGIFGAAVAAELVLLEMVGQQQSLEDVFVHITTSEEAAPGDDSASPGDTNAAPGDDSASPGDDEEVTP
jgi:ABC-2 type transport system ATP-binding protein